jgi:hypothetical protein
MPIVVADKSQHILQSDVGIQPTILLQAKMEFSSQNVIGNKKGDLRFVQLDWQVASHPVQVGIGQQDTWTHGQLPE